MIWPGLVLGHQDMHWHNESHGDRGDKTDVPGGMFLHSDVVMLVLRPFGCAPSAKNQRLAAAKSLDGALQPMERDELYRKAETIIRSTREKTKTLVEGGFICACDEDF